MGVSGKCQLLVFLPRWRPWVAICVSVCPCLPGLGLAAAACDFIPGNSENPSDGCDGVVAVVRAWPPDIQNQF